MTPNSTAQLVPEIHLCAGVHKPTCADLPAVEVICQAVVLNGVAYVWIDGINHHSPLLLPVQAFHQFRRMGSLRQYLENDKHLDLGDSFDELIDLCMKGNASATVLIRACEIKHSKNASPEQALITAQQWGMLLNELDQAERAAYQLVTSGVYNLLPEPVAGTVH